MCMGWGSMGKALFIIVASVLCSYLGQGVIVSVAIAAACDKPALGFAWTCLHYQRSSHGEVAMQTVAKRTRVNRCFPVSRLGLAWVLLLACLLSLGADETAEAGPAPGPESTHDDAPVPVQMIVVLRHDAAGGEPWTVPAVVVEADSGGPEGDAVIHLQVDDPDLVPKADQRVVQVQAVQVDGKRWRVAGDLRPWSASAGSDKVLREDLGERYRQRLAEAMLSQPLQPVAERSEPLAERPAGPELAPVSPDAPLVTRPERPPLREYQSLAAVLIPGPRSLVEYTGRLRPGPALLLEDAHGDPQIVRIEAVDGRFAIIADLPDDLHHLRLRQLRSENEGSRE